ncbi:RecQ family ATP-dependent DNA helicase [Allobacillus sp. GCM10007491]|uniref:ATP-dependent DNA helicase RecQ n=1 Tax=Allobacillus saliphilus TaxID=2912308 RepID=A0A941CVP5_9BACI|nr:RecQ family ATP-dependent DNA helicase [Allobacillus saliphilus]MBR7553278.1 ATP-dependent DNA helicase RecQ [Allobacillus saliphilus]
MNSAISNDIDQALISLFGFKQFRVGQREIIESIRSGNHTLATLPTGSGKSICYQLPALIGEGMTVVVSPLISLMVDQVKLLKAQGIKRVASLNSMMNAKQKSAVIHRLDTYKLLYCSPEMLQQEQVQLALSNKTIDYFVIDEAHCISQWGHEFRPDFLRLKDVIKKLNNPTVLALSATATPSIRQDIIKQLELPMKQLVYPIDRPNITFSVDEVTPNNKDERLIDLIEQKNIPTMIYFSSRKVSEAIYRLLQNKFPEREVAYYHGGMEQDERLLIQQQFMNNQLDIICCTSAFGMGVNKSNIRLVIHYHMPSTIESFIQEVGRAGRDGKQSVSILLYAPGDEYLPFQLIQTELPTENEVNLFFSEDIHKQPEDYLNETKLRFLELQKEQHHTTDQNEQVQRVIQYRNDREQIKQQSIFKLVDWIKTGACRRARLFSHFQQDVSNAQYECCDCCDFRLEEWRNKPETYQKKNKPRKNNWEAMLGELLIKG